MMKFEKYFFLILILFALFFATNTFAQAPAGSFRGQVTDPSGATISGADVIMTPAAGAPVVVQSNAQGMFEFKSLPAGKYILTVSAQGFALYENDSVVIADQPLRLNVSMAIAVEQEKVQVSDTAPTVDVNPTNNAGAIVLSGKELEALPDDPDELQSDLQALAGPSAGPNGGQMYIDGFTAGQLPPKSSIREIRVNQNPFSSEYDKLGYGRIEIFTKPGTDKWHGQIMVDGNDSPFNAPNPFAGAEPPYYSVQYNGNIGGPITKTSSFFFNIDRRNVDELSVINAVDPNGDGSPTDTIAESIPNPRTRTNVGPRFDWAITKNNTLTARYQYYRDTQIGEIGSQTNLPTQAYSPESTEHTIQISDTQVIGTKIINETRFQFNRDNERQTPADLNPQVSVLGSFTGGGNSEGTLNNLANSYEFQNYTSLITGNHTVKFGARVRRNHENDFTTSAFNGNFVFPTFADFQAALPSQFTITQGVPTAAVTYYDVEPYFQDDWRVRPNITISMGMRFEGQNAIHDHGDFAPRVGFAWGVGGRSGPPKVVIRGGSGVFYDRFQITQLLQAEHLNGINQSQIIITNPNPACYPGLDKPLTMPISSCGTPTSTTSTIYRLDPGLRAPYTLQSAVSVERQLTKAATLSATYINSRGFNQFLTINANAPFPGTPCYPNCAVPTQNIYQYVSEGNFKQNQLMVNTNVRVGSKLQLFGFYSFGHANSDASGVGSFPTNSYDISQDWGRASFDVRHRLFLGGSIAFPYLIRLSPFMIFNSGSPFNITSPFDLNGDAQYNNRPNLVSTATCAPGTLPTGSIYCTQYGTFDALGATGTPLPINYETGPNHFVMNFRLTKTFGFGPSNKKAGNNQNQGGGGPGPGGPRGGGGPRGPLFGGGGGPGGFSSNSDQRYNLTMGVSFRNAFNNLNVVNPNGTLGSPLFGIANNIQGGPFGPGTTANRRIDLIATFTF